MDEDELLDRVAVERLLSKLAEVDRVLMLLVYGVEVPSDWGGSPVTFATIGAYIGAKFEIVPLSEAGVRYRRDVLIKQIRGERGALRRPRTKPKKG